MHDKKVLITTIQPVGGGIPSMLRVVIGYLRQRDYRVTLAYYEPYSVSPELSVPLAKLPFANKPDVKESQFFGCDCVGVGCWLPELEFTHYWSTKRWQTLINEHSIHLSVSGSCLAALPYIQTSTPFMGWVASDWLGDREHRVRDFPLIRKIVDRSLITLVIRQLEKKIVASGSLVALSDYTKNVLNSRQDVDRVNSVLAMPVDVERFKPAVEIQKKYRIGFVGRFEDPRKNIELLLRSAALVIKDIPQLELALIGDELSDRSRSLAVELGILGNLKVTKYLAVDEVPDILRGLDLFILPSHQEGLCIAAMEAMSCGVPVVSTRCGGPETFVIHGENGVFVDSHPQSMADAILQLFADEKLRLSYSSNARKAMVDGFSISAQADIFWALFNDHIDTIN